MSSVDVKPTQPQARRQGRRAERAVQALARLLHARARASSRARDHLFHRQAIARHRAGGPEGAAPGAAAQAQSARGRHHSRARRFPGPAARLPQRRDPSPARAAESGRALAVRRGRTGAGRGDRRAPHGGRRLEPHRDARRQIPSQPLRRGAQPRRGAARRRGRDAGAGAPDGPEASGRRGASRPISGAPTSRRRPAATSTGSATRFSISAPTPGSCRSF